MKDAVLLELASRWESDAKEPNVGNLPPAEAGVRLPAEEQATRETLRMCAASIRTLVDMLGDKP